MTCPARSFGSASSANVAAALTVSTTDSNSGPQTAELPKGVVFAADSNGTPFGVEHLPPERLAEMVRLCGSKISRGGLLAIETPNPECLAIFATHFYLDPTHSRPVPAALLRFYLEETGFSHFEVERLAPAVESMPALAELPSAVRETFFGGLDYAIFARKL